jgi:hypothetical protein
MEGCSVEYGTRFSAASLRIWGFGWAMNPTSYRHGQRPVPCDAWFRPKSWWWWCLPPRVLSAWLVLKINKVQQPITQRFTSLSPAGSFTNFATEKASAGQRGAFRWLSIRISLPSGGLYFR